MGRPRLRTEAYWQQYKKNWNTNNKERLRQSRKNWRKRNPEKSTMSNAISQQKRRKEIRESVFRMYGGSCVRCGFSDWRALQLDHVEGAAAKYMIDGNIYPYRGSRLYSKVFLGKVPKADFQLLCANCNWIKREENGEYNKSRFING